MINKNGFSSKLLRINLLAALVFSCLLVSLSQMVFARTAMYSGKPAKYIFFFIGDGLGTVHRTATEAFMTAKNGNPYTLVMNQFPAHGLTTTYAADRFITGSAAAGTALATGFKTNINYIGVDTNFNPLETIAEKAKKKGMKVGIISSVSIDHATPASFYAHQPTRKMYHEISMELAKSDFDFFGGGGIKDPTGKRSKNPLGNVFQVAKSNGFKIVKNRSDFMKLNRYSGKVFAYNKNLPDGKALPYDMDNTPEDISITEFTAKAIELLDNPKGFFLMVEGGKIDWASHANDAAATIKDTLAFDASVHLAYKFYKNHPNDTLIVVTGDHECGGLTLGFAGTAYASHFDILKHQKISYKKFEDEVLKPYKKANKGKARFSDVLAQVEKYFGLSVKGESEMVLKRFEIVALEKAFIQSMSDVRVNKGTADYLLYGGYDPFVVQVTHILNNKAGMGWTTFSHTGVPVSTSAIGVGSETFNGYYDNTDLAKKIMAVLAVKVGS